MKIQKYVLFQIFQGVEKSILESGIKIKQEKIFRYIKAGCHQRKLQKKQKFIFVFLIMPKL